MSKINVGIIGIGRMGITHFSIINSHPDVNIVAVVDTSKIILQLIEKYLESVKTYTDYHKLFASEKLDAVIVCTPPSLHYPIVKIAGEKKVHVFSEKPFTTQKELGADLSDLFERNKLVNQVGYVNRFNDVFIKTKELYEKGLIGKAITFKSEMYSRTITKTEDGNTWRDSKEGGGGAVFEVASHAIDLVNFLLGKPDKITGSSLTKIYSKNVEDAVNATFLYKNGMSGTLCVNWSDESYRKPTNKIEILGSKGKILADQHSIKIFLKETNPSFDFRQGWNTLYITDVFKPVDFYVRGNEFTRQLYHFVACIMNEEVKNISSFKDACNTLDVIESIFSDYETNGKA
jgi:scyllo-inositol 2-dehydrogenase (NADP+)